MKMLKKLFFIGLLPGIVLGLSSCNKDEHHVYFSPALVTVIPTADEGFVMQLNDSVTMFATNLKKAPFGNREVRAQILYEVESGSYESGRLDVTLFSVDSIRTKLPVPDAGVDNNKLYGNDPLDIIQDWRTVAEDGYLTLRVRMRNSVPAAEHALNLVAGVNPNNPFEFELRHKAPDNMSDGRTFDDLIAFNLNGMLKEEKDVTLIIRWNSVIGTQVASFKLKGRRDQPSGQSSDGTDSFGQVW